MADNKTYTPHPLDTSDVVLSKDLSDLVNYIAVHIHDRWANDRLRQGYTYGESTDSDQKKNPRLRPFEALDDETKFMNINAVEQNIKFLTKSGYTISKPDKPASSAEAQTEKKTEKKLTWTNAESELFKRFYPDHSLPIYKAPLIIGVAAQECDSVDSKKFRDSMKTFFAKIFGDFNIPLRKENNRDRETPVFILSELTSPLEIMAAEYASHKYGVEIITVSKGAAPACSIPSKHITVSDDPHKYIVSNSFILLSFWDGISIDGCRVGSTVKKALLEPDTDNPSPSDTYIHSTHPVYHIVIPSKANDHKADFHWKTRLLLPYILESGSSWYTINRAVLQNNVLVSNTEAAIFNGKTARYCKDEVKRIKNDYAVRIRQLPRDVSSGTLKNIKKNRKNDISKLKRQISYNIALDKSKHERYKENCKKIADLNKLIASAPKAANKSTVYNQIDSSMQGRKLAAESVNLRHLRCDSIASAYQVQNRNHSIALALFAAIALCLYGIFSDFAPPHSIIGVLGGFFSAVFIIIALILFFRNKQENNHKGHLNIRLLSELLRVKLHLNAVGMTDENIGSYLNDRQLQELEWAQIVSSAWNVTDKADGFYDKDKNVLLKKDSDIVRKKWLGSADSIKKSDDMARYDPVSDGSQLDYARKKGSEFAQKAGAQERSKTLSSVAVVAFTVIITLLVFGFYISMAVSPFKDAIKTPLDEQFTLPEFWAHFESAVIYLIGIIPAIVACRLVYCETRMYRENALSKKWLAVKYQKIISCFDQASSDNEKKKIFSDAARVAVEEIGEWTLQASNSNISLPF